MESAFKALADDSRRTMIAALADGPATAGELAALLPIARPGVSRHLRVLREAGLVEVRQEAQRRVYTLRTQPLVEIDEWLDHHLALWEQRLDALNTEIARGTLRTADGTGVVRLEDQFDTDSEDRGLPLDQIASYGAGDQVHVEDLAAALAGRGRCNART